MAADWLPIRLDLHDDPAVIAIAGATGLDEFAVVGRLVRLWAWASYHLTDGNAAGVTGKWVDRYLAAPGFADAMAAAGWLEDHPSGVRFPRFDRWNSETAKKRALTARRVANHKTRKRDGNAEGNAAGNAPGVSGALPTEQKQNNKGVPPLNPLAGAADPPAKGPRKADKPPPFDPLAVPLPHPGPAFARVWAEWVAHRAEKKQRLTETSVLKQLAQLAALSEPAAVACVEKSIASGWTGLFPEQFAAGPGTPQARRPPMTAAEREQAEFEYHLGGLTGG